MDRKTVLIVDDEPSLRLLIRQALGETLFRLLEAGSGTEALALAREERPELVILDLHLPSYSRPFQAENGAGC